MHTQPGGIAGNVENCVCSYKDVSYQTCSFFFFRVKGEQIIYPARQKKYYKKVKLKFVIISFILGNYYSTTLREAN